jgi:hypothetical protein
VDAAVAALLGVGISAVAQIGGQFGTHRWQTEREERQARREQEATLSTDRRGLYARFSTSAEAYRSALFDLAHQDEEGLLSEFEEPTAAANRAMAASNEFHRLLHEVTLVAGSESLGGTAGEIESCFWRALRSSRSEARKRLNEAYRLQVRFVVQARMELGFMDGSVSQPNVSQSTTTS